MNSIVTRAKSWLRSLLRRDRLESEMEEEIRFHLESRTADLIGQGMVPREAARQARVEFGGMALHKDGMRASLGLRWVDELGGDLLYAVRILSKSPGFTAIAVASLALAIGANTTIFSFANQMLYVRLGVPHPEQLRFFSLSAGEDSVIHSDWGDTWRDEGHLYLDSFTYPVYQQLRRQNQSLEDIFAFKQISSVNVTASGTARVGKAELVSGNFYTQMGVKPQLGRPLEPADDGAPGSGAVAVLSDAFWHRAFGGSVDVIGKSITVNMTPVTIVGVNPPGFTSPDGVQTTEPQIFLPLSMVPVLHPATSGDDALVSTTLWWVQLMARAKPGISDARAEAALNVALNAAVRATITVGKGEQVPHLSLADGSRGDTSSQRRFAKPLYVLLGLSGLVLMLACANIANLMLARASSREREMSVRMALGAGRGRILRQVLTESLLLAAMGGVGGLFLGYLGRNLIPFLMRTGWQGGELSVPFDWRVFGFTSAVTLLTGIVFGLAPAWRSTHAEVNTGLKEGSRTSSRRRKAWSGKAIVGFQVALSTLLVMAAVFFLRTLINLNSIDPGFRAQNLLLLDINPPRSRYPPGKDIALQHRIEEAFAAVPGVEGVSLTNVPLIAGSMWNTDFLVEGAKDVKSTRRGDFSHLADLSDVGPQFFSVMSIPIVAGRAFTAEDTETSVPVSVINQTLAGKFFPGVNPIGRRFRMIDEGPGASRWIEVIGICGDTRYNDMKEPPPPIHFDLYRQSKEIGGVTLIVRSSLPTENLLPSLRHTVQQIDPDLPLSDVRTQRQQIAATMQQETMFASLSAGFGLLALALACVGIYGIMAYTVSQRTSEIGIRLALGAVRGQIRAMVLREAGWLALVGVLIGMGGTLALIRLVKSMLYGLGLNDPITLGGSAVLLLGVALLAGWIPANRASRVEPMEALRHD